jgi:hypothetical protein
MTQAIAGGWVTCPPGEITRLSAWLRFRRRLWTAAVVGGGVLAAAGTAGVTWAVREAVADRPAPTKPQRTRSTGPGKDLLMQHDDGKVEKPATRNTAYRK